MNEDFEMAIFYKKRITELEAKLIHEKTFCEHFWQNKPILTHEELLMRLVDLEPLFAKNHVAK